MIDATLEIALTIFVTLMLLAQLVALRFRIPYTLILVFIGIGVTAFAAASMGTNFLSSAVKVSVELMQSVYNQLVDSGLFVGLVVPPLLFEAMIHIKREELRKVIRPSLVLATIGVVLSTAVATFVVWKLGGLSFTSALIFAAIIAPTDTITVLQIFKRVRVPSRLSTLMDVEASFNDATAIVIFTIILSSIGIAHASLLGGIWTFLYSFIGGGAVGLAVALAARYIHVRIDDKLAETTLTIVAVYGSYVLAQGLGASGLIAVAVTGLYFGNNTMKIALSKKVRASIVSFWEIAAFFGNAIAFLFIGFAVNLSVLFQAAVLILVAYLATIVARMAAVYPTFAVFSRPGRRLPAEWSSIAVMGGVRGALSIALVATLAASGAVSSADLSTITTVVVGVVFISIIVQVPLLSEYAARLFGRHKAVHELQ